MLYSFKLKFNLEFLQLNLYHMAEGNNRIPITLNLLMDH